MLEPRIVSDQRPGAHSRYVVLRDGRLFTATPCYGLHEPWWVVTTMGDEAPPEPMANTDQWWPLKEYVSAVAAAPKLYAAMLGDGEITAIDWITSLLGYFLDECYDASKDIDPTATNEMIAAVEKFLREAREAVASVKGGAR